MIQNIWGKIAENLNFVENINFIRESIVAAACGYSGTNLQKITQEGLSLQKSSRVLTCTLLR